MVERMSTQEALIYIADMTKKNMERLMLNPDDERAARNLMRLIEDFKEVKEGKAVMFK